MRVVCDDSDGHAEVLGYSKLQAILAPPNMVTQVKRSLLLQSNLVAGPAIFGRRDRNACEGFLKFGINDGERSGSFRGSFGTSFWASFWASFGASFGANTWWLTTPNWCNGSTPAVGTYLRVGPHGVARI